MKNVLLIGDSIRMGYDKAVKKSLEGKAEVFFPQENCRFAAFVLRNLHEYKSLLPEGKADVVHWNAGLWDCLRLFGEEPQTPIDIYAYYIERICVRIKKVYPDARVIFATSTAIWPEKMRLRRNEEIEQYNQVASDIARKHGFEVNDLYAVSTTLPEEAHSDGTHYYTPQGTEAFANAVLSHLLPALDINEEIVYKEELHTDKPIGF